MDNLLKILIAFLSLLILIQLIYSFITFSSFSCPDCPECPEQVKNQMVIPSNTYTTDYITEKFLMFDDDVKSIDFLKSNVIFANNYVVNFEQDAQSIMTQFRNERDNMTNIYIDKNIRYIQSTDEEKKKKFDDQFNLSTFPSPLIFYEGSKLLYGYIKEKKEWKILVDIGNFQ